MIHAVKIEPRFYRMVINGLKPYEVRFNDRDYRVGDYLALNEWDAEKRNTPTKQLYSRLSPFLTAKTFRTALIRGM